MNRPFFQDEFYEIIRQKEANLNLEQEISKLPYIFKEPIKFDKLDILFKQLCI